MLSIPENTRLEIKYVCNQFYYYPLKNWINLNLNNFIQEYPARKVNNIYYDNFNYDCYKSNIHGISSRAKFRFRWYGEIENTKNLSYEIKFKRNTFGWKSKEIIKNINIFHGLSWKSLNCRLRESLNMKNKIFFDIFSAPTILNTYSRDYFISYDKKIRITLDKNHYVYDQRNSKTINLNFSFSNPQFLIMEIKFDRKYRENAKEIIKSLPIIQTKNSKYSNSIRMVSGI